MESSAMIRIIAWLILLLPGTAFTANWPAWRGSSGIGICNEKEMPITWSATENVLWKIPLPEPGISTPVVWGNRLFMTQAEGSRRLLWCLDKHTGKILWKAGPSVDRPEPIVDGNPLCTPSPVTDGRRVVAWFGSAGVYCFDFDGREIWRRDLGKIDHQWSYSSSPILYRGICVLNFGPGTESYLYGLDVKTGKTRWQVKAPDAPIDAKLSEFGNPPQYDHLSRIREISGSWSTPIIVRSGRRDELLATFPLALHAFDPSTGRELWRCAGLNIAAQSSPISDGKVAVASGGGMKLYMMAVRPGGTGDVAATRRLWVHEWKKNHFGSGVIHGDHAFFTTYEGFAECVELKTGKIIYQERLPAKGAATRCWSSCILAGDLIYAVNDSAETFVWRASPKFEVLKVNPLETDRMGASPAISDGRIFLRTYQTLWCIGKLN